MTTAIACRLLPSPSGPWTIHIPGLRLSNPLNGATGHSKLAGVLRSRERRRVRSIVRGMVVAATPLDARRRFAAGAWTGFLVVHVTRIGPRDLDAWDGLPASCKPVVDGIADAFGVRDDDPRFEWEKPSQERSPPGRWAVRIEMRWDFETREASDAMGG